MQTIEIKALVVHLRRMLAGTDAFSILIRGLSLLDEALAALIDHYAAISLKEIKKHMRAPSLLEKAVLCRALGAISDGEYACIAQVNGLRNKVAHRIDYEVINADEREVVKTFKKKTKLFSGLDYIDGAFPRTFAFVLVTFFASLHLRTCREDVKLSFIDDETNVEGMAAIAITLTLFDVMKDGVENDDDAINSIVKKYTDAALALRDRGDTAESLTRPDE